MRTYKHKIAKSTLEKKYKLNENQIASVYTYKSKASQESAAKRYAASNKAIRMKKYYKTSLAEYNVSKRIKSLEEFSQSDAFKNLTKRQKRKYEKEYIKLTKQFFIIKTNLTETRQSKMDLKEAREHKLAQLRARMNAGEKVIYKHRSRDDSYGVNDTINKSRIDYITSHYADDLDELLKGKKDKNGNWIQEPMTFDEAITTLFEIAIKEGEIEPLQQGIGYGYIDKDNKEIISPV